VQMGSPPSFVDGLLQHARMAMLKPDLLLKWKQAWSKFVLLHGTTGCGKSMTVDLLSRRLAELVSEVTNVPIGDLPPRIFRLRPSQIYNKYVGESDKNMARFVREVVQVAAQPFEAPDGRVYERIPTIAVLEEIDGVGRARGQGDQVFDRILSSLLQELDPGRPHMSEHLVFWVSTTNLLKQIDTALVRRAGAQIYKMGQLNRRGFTSVLSTHLQGLPLAGPNGTTDPDATHRWFVGQVTNWLYCPNGDDPGQVKVVFANGEPATKYRRDLMTGALVARSVAEAKTEGSGLEFQTGTSAGLTTQGLMESLDRQVQSTAEQISPHNIATLLEIPEGAHVREVQRIRQPSLQPFQLRRVS